MRHELDHMISGYESRKIPWHFTGLKGPVRDAFQKVHLLDKVGANHFFMSVHEAVKFHQSQGNKTNIQHQTYTLQTND